MFQHKHDLSKSCLSKTAYSIFSQADKMTKVYQQIAYNCFNCGQYHLTKKRNKCNICCSPTPLHHSSYRVLKSGRIFSLLCNRVLTPNPHKSTGYIYVKLKHDDTGEFNPYSVHRLVAIAHIPNPYNKPIVNHKDLNKVHNHPSNLEWSTSKENTNHYFSNRE